MRSIFLLNFLTVSSGQIHWSLVTGQIYTQTLNVWCTYIYHRTQPNVGFKKKHTSIHQCIWERNFRTTVSLKHFTSNLSSGWIYKLANLNKNSRDPRGTSGVFLICPGEGVMEKRSRTATWWLNQPIWKNIRSNWIISPGIGVNIKKYLKPPPIDWLHDLSQLLR